MAQLRPLVRLQENDGVLNDINKAYLEASVQFLGNELAPRIHSSSYGPEYRRHMQTVDRGIQTWMAWHRAHTSNPETFNVDNHTVYRDPLDHPYMRNGVVVVVLASRFYNPYGDHAAIIGGRAVRYSSVRMAAYDPYLNRVYIQPWFAEALRRNRVFYTDVNGNRTLATLAHVIHHELGHAGEQFDNRRVMTTASRNTVLDESGVRNNIAEHFEFIGQRVDPDPDVRPRQPHGHFEFRNDAGEYVRIGQPGSGQKYMDFVRAMGGVPIDPYIGVIKDGNGQWHIIETGTGETTSVSLAGGQIGKLAGSSLGNFLARDEHALVQIATSTVLGSIGQAFGDALSLRGHNIDLSDSFEVAFKNFDQTLFNNLKSAAIGSLSTFTAMELGRAVGISGFGAELFNAAAGSAVAPIYDKVIGNLLSGDAAFHNFSLKSVFGSGSAFGDLAGSSVSSFLGAKLGAQVISPTSSAGAALASLGSAIGSYGLSAAGSSAIGGIAAAVFAKLGAFSNIIGPGIGSFAGYILGALIGKLFGSRKPRIPSAEAEVALNLHNSKFQLGAVTVVNNGNRDLVTTMAATAVNALNGLVEQTLQGVVQNTTSDANQGYGHSGSQIRARLGGASWQNFARADEAVEWGILNSIRQIRVAGGALLSKRAIALSPADTLSSLFGDLQVAADYEVYLRNASVINQMIQSSPQSAFSAAWAITLGRAAELKLNKFQPSDFYGGLPGFASSFGFGAHGSFAYENIGLDFEGASLRIKARDGAELFDLFAASNNVAAADAAKSVLIPNFNISAGYTFWSGGATAGNDIALAGLSAGPVTLDDSADGGDDIFSGSAHNDHLYGRSGYDWLDGDSGHDWIEGGGQNDVLLGRAGTDVLIGGEGDDYLAGGDGDDYPAEWRGGLPASGGLHGQAGNDTLVGGEGWDYLNGGDGDDTFVIDQDAQFGWQWDELWGEAGSDTASFERFAGGVAVHMNNGKDGWYSTQTHSSGWRSIENVTGTDYADEILGDAQNNVLRGLAGNDYILGDSGNDVIEGGAGADYMDGGYGDNTLSYRHSGSGVLVNLATRTALGGDGSGDVFYYFKHVRGSDFGDDLAGDAEWNALDGGKGDDVFRWSVGWDSVHGGEGFDTFDATGSSGALTVSGGAYASLNGWTTSLNSVESYIGTTADDSIEGGAADEVFDARYGWDWLTGGGGSDTYLFGRGDGWDHVYETTDAHNSIVLKEGLDWRDVAVLGGGWQNGATLTVSITATGEYIAAYGNVALAADGSGNHNHKIKTLDLGGVSAVEIGAIDFAPAGIDTDYGTTTIHGAQSKADLIFAYGGDDWFSTAGYWGGHEISGNVVYAGRGLDSIFSSVGDDQYIFERGDGADFIDDRGGADTIVMGPSVAADDVIYEVKVKYDNGPNGKVADLYVGIRDPDNPDLPASQVADRILIQDGGTIYHDLDTGVTKLNTIEHVRVGGQEIDLTRANIDFVKSYYQSYTGGGGGGHVPPLAIDLDGDGIELRSVEGSRITTVDADGNLWRVGWISPDDGFLALDRNGDGAIDRLTEISFTQDLAGAKSDLEGLAAFDSNADGVLDAKDARWAEFKVWRDRNQDGVGVGRELVGLAEAGIVSIGLKGTATGFTGSDGMDSAILATTTIGWADPTRKGLGYDIALAVRQVRTDGGGQTMADLHARAGGRGKADAIDASLYGIQALTETQIEAVKAKPKKDAAFLDAGLLGRVETFLPGASAGEDGLWKVAGGAAAHARALGEAKDAEAGRGGDRFADTAWTLAAAAARPERDRKGDAAVPVKPEMSPEARSALARGIVYFEEQKRLKAAEDQARAAREQAERNAPLRAPPPPPSPEEMARRAEAETFRFLGKGSDSAAGASPAVPAASVGKNVVEAAVPLAVEVALARSAAPAPGPVEPGTVDAASPPSAATRAEASLTTQDLPREPLGETDPREGPDYAVSIEAANARLIQALAGFSVPAAMMSDLAPASEEGEALTPWISVDRMASVGTLMHVG